MILLYITVLCFVDIAFSDKLKAFGSLALSKSIGTISPALLIYLIYLFLKCSSHL